MGLTSEMKNLSEEILASFKQRINEREELLKKNEELIIEVQKTLDGFRKDHQEMANVIKTNAANLRNDLAAGEKERLTTYKNLMTDIHATISGIQKEVDDIQASTLNMINEFTHDRKLMADELDKFFANNKSNRMLAEKMRMKEFDDLMNSINLDIRNINTEVSNIIKNTNNMLDNFDKEHAEMSAELRAKLGKNLAERIEYTRTLLNGFQKRLAQISKENHQTAQKLRKDLAMGETVRLNEYKEIMNGIHKSIKGIRKEVNDIQKYTIGMLDDLTKDRSGASAEWKKMQDAIARLKEQGMIAEPVENKKKAEKKEAKKEAPAKAEPKKEPEPEMTLEEKVLDYINKNPNGLRISDLEAPMGETRMKLGYVAKKMLDEGKVLKVENLYYPKPKLNL
jgi:hypothetical protein